MTEPDARLAALLAQDEPAARDPVFLAAVMQRFAHRRLAIDIAALVPSVAAAMAVLWAATPVLASPLLASPALVAVAGVATLLASLWYYETTTDAADAR